MGKVNGNFTDKASGITLHAFSAWLRSHRLASTVLLYLQWMLPAAWETSDGDRDAVQNRHLATNGRQSIAVARVCG